MPIEYAYLEKIFEEVVTHDSYHVRQMKHAPDVIYDIGANVGMFSVFCRIMFPYAKIIAVEPEAENFERLERTVLGLPGIVTINAALGEGDVLLSRGKESGYHSFVTASVMHPLDAIRGHEGYEETSVPAITLAELYKRYGGINYMVKLDCEGAEVHAMYHDSSRAVLDAAMYIVGELHFYAATQALRGEAYAKRLRFINKMQATHQIWTDLWENGATVVMTRKDRV